MNVFCTDIEHVFHILCGTDVNLMKRDVLFCMEKWEGQKTTQAFILKLLIFSIKFIVNTNGLKENPSGYYDYL